MFRIYHIFTKHTHFFYFINSKWFLIRPLAYLKSAFIFFIHIQWTLQVYWLRVNSGCFNNSFLFNNLTNSLLKFFFPWSTWTQSPVYEIFRNISERYRPTIFRCENETKEFFTKMHVWSAIYITVDCLRLFTNLHCTTLHA